MEDRVTLTERILRLFETDSEGKESNLCLVCGLLSSGDEVELSVETVKVLLQVLLVEIVDKNGMEYSTGRVCRKCSGYLDSMLELYHKLEVLRKQFNELRTRVGKWVIVGSLGESEEIYERWVVDVESVKDVFPSEATKRLMRTKETAGSYLEVTEDVLKSEGEDEMFAEEPLEFLEYSVDNFEKEAEDPKLTQMRAAVVIRRLSVGKLECQVQYRNKTEEPTSDIDDEKLHCEAEEGVKASDNECNANPTTASPVLEFDDGMTDVGTREVPEFSMNLRPKRSISARPRDAVDAAEGDEDDDFCPHESESSSSCGEDSEGQIVDTQVEAENFSFRKMIICGYCDLTFPTKLSWRKHQRRVHSEKRVNARNSRTGSFKSGARVRRKAKMDKIVVDAIRNYEVQNPKIVAIEIMDRLLSDEICDQHNVPLVASIERILRKMGAEKVPERKLEGGAEEFVEDESSQNESESSGESPTEEFPCGYCDMTFSKKLKFREHRHRIHSLDSANPKTPKCPYCLRMFVQKAPLSNHVDVVHFGVYGYTNIEGNWTENRVSSEHLKDSKNAKKIHCSICDIMKLTCFSSVEELEAHAVTESHLEKAKMKLNIHCNICRVGFGGNVEALAEHFQTQKHKAEITTLGIVNTETFCVACRLDCVTRNELKTHRSSRTHWKVCSGFMGSPVPLKFRRKQNIKCSLCPQRCSNEEVLRVHFKTFHKRTDYACEFCGKEFLCLRDYSSHRRRHKFPKPFACSKCSRSFETKRKLGIHKANFHSGISLVCPTCGKMFKTKVSLDTHEQWQHQTVEERVYKYYCEKCSKGFLDVSKLRRHNYKVHKDDVLHDTPHVCHVCFKGFKTSHELNVHMATHDGLKCYFCGKYFEKTTNHENHVRMHIEEKPFACTFCDKKFGALHNMQAHVRWHIKMNKKGKPSALINEDKTQ